MEAATFCRFGPKSYVKMSLALGSNPATLFGERGHEWALKADNRIKKKAWRLGSKLFKNHVIWTKSTFIWRTSLICFAMPRKSFTKLRNGHWLKRSLNATWHCWQCHCAPWHRFKQPNYPLSLKQAHFSSLYFNLRLSCLPLTKADHLCIRTHRNYESSDSSHISYISHRPPTEEFGLESK